MYDMYGLRIEQHSVNHPVTPETLRAAAKVLEDKAKELSKPKLTPKQLRLIEYCKSKGRCDLATARFKGNSYTCVYHEGDQHDENYFDIQESLIKGSKFIHTISECWNSVDSVHIHTFIDEDGDLSTCIDIDS